ncbi:MAG: hypothetical protein EZS28_053146, partial [Streblomastix strix]
LIGIIRLYCPTTNNFITTIENINTFPIRIISSFPGQNPYDWDIIYTAVNRLQYYGQFIPDVLTQFSIMNQKSALDLYDGLSENAANLIVNNASSVKFIDLETWKFPVVSSDAYYYSLQLDVRNHLIGSTCTWW